MRNPADLPFSIIETGKARRTGFAFDERCLSFSSFPETSERVSRIRERLKQSGLLKRMARIEPVADPLASIRRVHTDETVRAVRGLPGAGQAAFAAVGAILGAVRDVAQGKVQNAFCAVRPPGHHAPVSPWQDSFCFLSNAAVAARYAQEACGIPRVLIVDWDFHHGNGTEEIFYRDDSVLFFSTHHAGAYPRTGDPSRTGEGPGAGTTVNVHLDAGSGDPEMDEAWENLLLPKVREFKPGLLIISAGFDSRAGDPLGCFTVTDAGFAALTDKAVRFMEEYGDGRIVSVLEGGYDVEGLSCGAAAHAASLMGFGVEPVSPADAEAAAGVLKPLCRYGWLYWPKGLPLRDVHLAIHRQDGAFLYAADPAGFRFGALNIKRPDLASGGYFVRIESGAFETLELPFRYSRNG